MDGAELLGQVKAMLCERGALSVRGCAQVFKILDKNNNRLIDSQELDAGLRDMGVNLVPEQVDCLLKYFDKDGSGQISLQEFMTKIRVSIILILANILLSYDFNFILGRLEHSKNVLGSGCI